MVYMRSQTRQKPLKSQSKKFDAPVAGWIANRSLSDPRSIEGSGAAILDNFWPGTQTVMLRRGKERYATFDDNSDVRSMFVYSNGLDQRLFAASDTTIYDISAVPFPTASVVVNENDDEIADGEGNVFGWSSVEGLDVMAGFSGGDWSVAQFATDGGVYLVGVNGTDVGFIFDGSNFYPNVAGGVWALDYTGETVEFTSGAVVTGGASGATATIYAVMPTESGEGALLLTDVSGTFEDGEMLTDEDGGSAQVVGSIENACPGMDFGALGLTSADMSFVWVHKGRLWFVQKNSMTAWYMPIAMIGGTADYFPLDGVFTLGGSLLFGAPWSLNDSGVSGLSEQCIFTSTEGEVAVYQGSDPSEAGTWSKVGLYRVGRPLGKRAFFRGGGDIAIATTTGLVPLSKAVQLDVTALNVAMISYRIADAWSDAIRDRGTDGWTTMLWPDKKMAVISPPDIINEGDPIVFVTNTESGAWARFTNWNILCMEVFRGQLYIGSPEGRIFRADATGVDDGEAYSGTVLPLFEDFGNPSSLKIGKVARAVVRANTEINELVEMHVDYDMQFPAAPDASPINAGNSWGAGVWGESVWGKGANPVISEKWQSIGNMGYACSLSFQITSGSITPIDAELIRLEMTYTNAALVT